MDDYTDDHSPLRVKDFSGISHQSSGVGSVKLMTAQGPWVIPDVAYVPEAAANLLSTDQLLQDQGFYFLPGRKKGYFVSELDPDDGPQASATTTVKHGLHFLDLGHPTTPAALVATSDLALEHQRAGHRNVVDLRRGGCTHKPLTCTFSEAAEFFCEECALAKGKKTHDKRETIKERDWKRDQQRIMKAHS